MDVEGSWIPVTPVKPGGAPPQPICTEKPPNEDNWLGSEQGIHIGQPSWEEFDRFSTGLPGTQQADVWYGSTSGVDVNRGFDLWDEGMGFTDLLELANVATTATDPANGAARVEGNTDFVPGTAQYGCSTPSRLSFDLNSLPKTITDPVLNKTISSKFAPITPDQSKRQASDVQNLSIEDRTNQARNEKHNEVANERVEVIEINDETEESQEDKDQSCTQLQENHNPDTGIIEGTDLNKTPQLQKPRRRKHRPKVVIEGGKPARPRKPNTTKPAGPKEATPTGKRKYVRKKGLEKPPQAATPPSDQANAGPSEPKTVERAEKSCRRSLNFDNMQSQVRDESSSYRPPSNFSMESHAQNFSTGVQSTVQIGPGMEVRVEKTQVGIAYDLTRSMSNIVQSYLSMPDKQAPSPSENASTRGKCRINFSDETHDKETSSIHTITNTNSCSANLVPSPNDSTCSSNVCLNKGEQARGLKRVNSSTTHEAINAFGSHYNSLQAFGAMFPINGCRLAGMHFPAIHKKKRTEKVHGSATSSTSTVTAIHNTAIQNAARQTMVGTSTAEISCRYSSAQFNASTSTPMKTAINGSEDKNHPFNCMLALGQGDKLKKKRSKGPTRVRDYASLIGMVPLVNPAAGRAANRPHTCMEALAADTRARLARKKRTKRNSLVNLPPSMQNYQYFKSMGRLPAIKWKGMYSIDVLVEQFSHLNINADQFQNALVPYNRRYHMRYHEQNALVLYHRDGTLVPFEGAFNPIKKRKPRPKVNLDDETTRVWKLLLQDINSVGIDGTDEEKARWWEEERRVFRGRADSFIARMHLVQGDRRFSKWKGSVVDSVVGVFLTQNVSDHLSSSAFMSLAARYPLKSKRTHDQSDEEEITRLVQEPEVCVVEPDDAIEWCEDKSNLPFCDQNSMTIQDVVCNKEKDVNGNESGSSTDGIRSKDNLNCSSPTQITGKESIMGDQRELDDVISSQNSVASSQNSVDSSIAQTVERTGSCSQSNSETDPTAPRDFNGPTSFLELLRRAHGVFNQESGNEQSSWKNPLESRASDPQEQGPKPYLTPAIPTSDRHLHLNPNSVEVESFEMLGEESRFSSIPKKNNEENCASEQSGVSAESANQAAREVPKSSDENSHSCQLLTEMNKTSESQRIAEDPRINATESTSIVDNSKNETMAVESNLNTSKAKSGKAGKEKQNVVDWDILRKEAQANGVREKEPNTMDSVDWEAIRCADVNEIAYTIRERGMNNMLAERIKDFLNRLVRDHGSIDLEWLRDVPPDKAKEYLLSIRGLGLKSVECVRLLTLHHLAFPVDTNVGRIAVRLGWVPLQPLPESLQLHLLELYPILESIQKYLWPRLCKLDQRTLYELHYQMITFGKVFCTKSKPNCNACPMRGECRHFASAFASARLALPAPEEKSIVSATENIAPNQAHMGPINRLQLPPPQPNQQLVQSEACNNRAPIIEEPASPEPVIEVPPSPEPERTEIMEFDIEDTCEDPEEIPTIKLNIEEFTQNLQNYMQQNMELQEGDVSKALVALTSEAASIPTPKLKNVSRLRTEHQVYELPDSHPLLEGLDRREPDDPCSYLLAIWTPGETPDSVQPPEGGCIAQESGRLCEEKTCFSCNNIREANSQTVRGTLLIPCRTAMRGSFPLNGTYFQVNEVFADHDSSLKPIDVPRAWIWNLPRRTVYFGTSIPTIFKGLSTEGIQFCFWRGFVCVRGFDQKTRAPRPLMARLHFPASKLVRTKGKPNDEN